MKKIVLLIFILSTSTLQSQTLSFEETVNYINKKLECCSINYDDNDSNYQYKPAKITVTTDGMLTVINTNKKEYKISILSLFGKKIESDGEYVLFYYTSTKQKQWRMISSLEAEKTKKALLHLMSLCVPEKDPFDE